MDRLRLRRIYAPPSPQDGLRVLVDRVWPRGVARAAAQLDLWLPEIAPTAELRRWFGHDPARWAEFRARYLAEIAANAAILAALRDRIGAGPATLLFGARDEMRNQAVVLREALLDLAETRPPSPGGLAR